MNHGRQLRLFLADGTSSGPRFYEIVNRTIQALCIPATRIKELTSTDWPEIQKSGVYLVHGTTENAEERLYIGKGENVASRVQVHPEKLDFDVLSLILFTSKDENLNASQVGWLESNPISAAKEANPITVIEQISYLMFARLLDITESRNEKRASRLKKTDFKGSLDDKRTPQPDKNDLPDLIKQWKARNPKKKSDRSAKHFFVPVADIRENKYDLSLNRYKVTEHEESTYEPPKTLLKRMETRMQAAGIHTVEQLCGAPKEKLHHLWGGVTGNRFWHLSRGEEIPDVGLERDD
ncbi:MAG: hypothetical protein K9N23_12120 [Akkermansiaceae bacterium]|nr:hypothetical protein [Akkermansiaceae bacterium]